MHRVYVPGALPPVALLPPDEAHHAIHVLRLTVGDEVVVFDGRGCEWSAQIATVSRSDVTATLGASRTPVAEPSIRITLAIGLLKGDQMDAVVRDATMLGVQTITPLISAHVVVPKAAHHTRATERWQRVAVAAAKQCARAVVPDLTRPVPLTEMLNTTGVGPVVMCVEPAHAGDAEVPGRPVTETALLLVGPEGGWSREEMALARSHSVSLLSLGPRVLRAESAPAVALSVLWSRWGWT